jgi:hypothetical protein
MTMEYVRLGRSSLKMSHIALGGMGIGDPAWRSSVLRGDAARPIVARALEHDLGDATALRFFSATEEPWNLVRGCSSAALTRRYSHERGTARFGIYWDTHEKNRAHRRHAAPMGTRRGELREHREDGRE